MYGVWSRRPSIDYTIHANKLAQEQNTAVLWSISKTVTQQLQLNQIINIMTES